MHKSSIRKQKVLSVFGLVEEVLWGKPEFVYNRNEEFPIP